MRLTSIGGLPVRTSDEGAIVRDIRDYRAAKLSRGDTRRLRLRGEGEATSRFLPDSYRSFDRYLGQLKENPDAHRAAEKLIDLEHALMKRHSVPLPKPRLIEQRNDPTNGNCVAVFWGPEGHGITVLVNEHNIVALIGGTAGKPIVGPRPQLLDALAFQAKLGT